MAKLILLPGLDGTGDLFAPLIGALGVLSTQVVSYPADRLCGTFASNPLPLFGPLRRVIGVLPAMRIPAGLMAPLLYAGRATPELRRLHSQAMSRVAPSTIHARVAAILAVDYRPLLRRIEVPMLYMRALADRLIPGAAGRAIMQLRPDVELAEIDAPHFLLQTESRQCADSVVHFVRRHAADS